MATSKRLALATARHAEVAWTAEEHRARFAVRVALLPMGTDSAQINLRI